MKEDNIWHWTRQKKPDEVKDTDLTKKDDGLDRIKVLTCDSSVCDSPGWDRERPGCDRPPWVRGPWLWLASWLPLISISVSNHYHSLIALSLLTHHSFWNDDNTSFQIWQQSSPLVDCLYLPQTIQEKKILLTLKSRHLHTNYIFQ